MSVRLVDESLLDPEAISRNKLVCSGALLALARSPSRFAALRRLSKRNTPGERGAETARERRSLSRREFPFSHENRETRLSREGRVRESSETAPDVDRGIALRASTSAVETIHC